MAVEPLYNADLDTLLKIVRIEPADDVNTLAAVDQAVRDVRLGLYSRLGKTRALEITGYALTDNPTTDDEISRSNAASAEALWLTILLVQRLPVLFMDNASSVGDIFNGEPLTRDAMGVHTFLDYLKAQLEDKLEEIADDESNLNKAVKSSLNGPSTTYLISETFIGGGCSTTGASIVN